MVHSMKALRLAALFAVVLLLSGCFSGSVIVSGIGQRKVVADGNMVTREYPAENFDKLSLAAPIDVEFVQTDSLSKVEITASQNVIPLFEVKSSGSELSISMQNSQFRSLSLGEVSAKVYSPSIKGMYVAGAGSITSSSVKTPKLEITVAGSGDVAVKNLEADRVNADIAGSGDIEASGRFGETFCSVEGSGDIDLDGTYGRISASVAGSGDIKLYGVSKSASIGIRGSGVVDISGLKYESLTKDVHGSGGIMK